MSDPGPPDNQPEGKASPSLEGDHDVYKLVVFTLDQRRYALHLSAVERVVRVVEVLPLPQAPEIVLGVVNLQGRIVPVVDVRKRFRLAARETSLSDRLVIGRAARMSVGFMTDSVEGVVERSGKDMVTAESILPGLELLEGVAKLEDGMVLIHDLERFLSLDEAVALEKALGTKP
jgi:purine-binding chemotaxis protein CheW